MPRRTANSFLVPPVLALALAAAATPALAQPCREWVPWAPENRLNSHVNALASIDHGDGVPRLYAGGYFTQVGGAAVNGVAVWNGQAWSPLGNGLQGLVFALAAFDPDGPGPAPRQLYAGGEFQIGGTRGIARWDGAQWQPVGGGVLSEHTPAVRNMVEFDPDGDGPLPARLVISGDFSSVGGVPAPRIAAWDGQAWHAMGDLPFAPYALLVADDGAGVPALYAGGFSGVRRWDGEAWVPVPMTGLLYPSVESLAFYDEDGPGPQPPRLFAGGSFFDPSGNTHSLIARREDDGTWTFPGGGIAHNDSDIASWVYQLMVVDLDGPGPGGPVLVAAGNFGSAGGVTEYIAAAWDGSAWSSLETNLQCNECGDVRAVAVHDVTGGRAAPELFLGGRLHLVGGVAASNLARSVPTGAPVILTEPQPATVRRGGAAVFAAAADGPAPHAPLAFRWRRDGQDLADGPTPDGATITGSDAPTLTITGAGLPQAGHYTLLVTNACAGALTLPATLTIECPADWNGDGGINSSDLSAFISTWLSSVQTGHAGADFNADGTVNSSDLSAFISAWLSAVQGGC